MCVGSLSRGRESIRARGTVDAKAQKRGCLLVSGGGPRAGRPDGNRGGQPASHRFGGWGDAGLSIQGGEEAGAASRGRMQLECHFPETRDN